MRTITVKGTGDVSARPDYIILSLNIEVLSETYDRAMSEAAERIERLQGCKKEKVRVIFVQPEFDRRNADLIAQQTGTRVVAINPLSYDWEEEMMNTARALVKE